MNAKKLFICVTLLISTFTTISAQEGDVVTNETVITMLKEGFSSNDVIGIIQSASSNQINYNLAFLRELKAAGANEELTSFLSKLKANANEAAKQEEESRINQLNGVYWINDSSKDYPEQIPYNVFTLEEKNSGLVGKVVGRVAAHTILRNTLDFGKAMAAYDILGSSGFKSEKLKLDQPQADTKVGRRPVFRFYLSQNINNADEWFTSWIRTVSNPNEFQCVKLDPKKKCRSFPAGMKIGTMGIEVPVNSNTKNVIDFKVRQYDATTYEVSFPEDLEPGEYCFYYKNTQNAALGKKLVAFDFSVK